MDPRLLQFYTQELAHVRDVGAEFATRFPKIASRLGMDATEVHDPYVERLLEGFAFLTARVQLRLHEEFPRFTEQLLNRISPNFLAPMPAMGVVQFNTNAVDIRLKKGIDVPADTVLQSQLAKGIGTPCQFRVGHAFTLWPLEIQAIEHGAFRGTPPTVRGKGTVRSALHLRLGCTLPNPLRDLSLDNLDLHVSCGDEYAYTLFDRVCYKTVSIAIRGLGQTAWEFLPADSILPLGLIQEHALLPADSTQFSGTRLLQEFFTFPQRFLFFRIQGLQRHLSQINQSALEIALCFTDLNAELDRVVDNDSLALHCTPVVNLFEHACDRIFLDERLHEVHLIASRTKPQDFEVHSLLNVKGYGQNLVQVIPPLYANSAQEDVDLPRYMFKRVPTQASEKRSREGGRSSYIGSEVYVGLTQPAGELIQQHGLQQLGVRALCTNRDLPLLMPIGQSSTDLAWPGNLPLQSIRFLRGPSRPKAPIHSGQASWQLIEHLSVNYLGLVDAGNNNQGQSAAVLTQLLSLHSDPAQPSHQQLARAVHSVQAQTMVSRVLRQGRPAAVRGLQVTLTLDELLMQSMGMGVLGSVLARYLAAHVSVNSFVQTRVTSLHTGAIFEFPAMSGNRPLL